MNDSTQKITEARLNEAIRKLCEEKARIRKLTGQPFRPTYRPIEEIRKELAARQSENESEEVHISFWEWCFAIVSLLVFGILAAIPQILGILAAIAINFFIGMSVSKGIRTAGKGLSKAAGAWKRL